MRVEQLILKAFFISEKLRNLNLTQGYRPTSRFPLKQFKLPRASSVARVKHFFSYSDLYPV